MCNKTRERSASNAGRVCYRRFHYFCRATGEKREVIIRARYIGSSVPSETYIYIACVRARGQDGFGNYNLFGAVKRRRRIWKIEISYRVRWTIRIYYIYIYRLVGGFGLRTAARLNSVLWGYSVTE